MKKWLKIVLIMIIILLLLGLIYIISLMNIFPIKYNKGGPNLTSFDCQNLGGEIVNAELRNKGCDSKNDLLGQVTDLKCNCVCCKK